MSKIADVVSGVMVVLWGCDAPLSGRKAQEPSEGRQATAEFIAESPCPAASFDDDIDLSRRGVCDGAFEADAPTDEQLDALRGRVRHEAMHVAAVLAGASRSGLTTAAPEDGLVGVIDNGYLRGVIADDGDVACATVRFHCWSGGHGGWGFAALDGTLTVRLEGDVVTLAGNAGLLGGEARDGTPVVDVGRDRVLGVPFVLEDAAGR